MNELDVVINEKPPKWLVSRLTGAVLRCKTLDELQVRRAIGSILCPILHNAVAREEGDLYLKRVVNRGTHFSVPIEFNAKLTWARKAAKVWRIYDEMATSGKRVSLNSIGRKAGIDYNCVGRILDRLGIGRGKVAHRKINLSAEHRDAVDRTLGAYGNLAASDLAYFLRTGEHVIYNHRRNLIARGQGIGSCERVTGLELASRIYECTHETDFSNTEIGNYVGCSERTVERKIGASGVLVPLISKVLRTVYPARVKDVPYRNKNDKFD